MLKLKLDDCLQKLHRSPVVCKDVTFWTSIPILASLSNKYCVFIIRLDTKIEAVYSVFPTCY